MLHCTAILLAALLCWSCEAGAAACESCSRVNAAQVANGVTPLMHGARIEDVNHEIYGGMCAQMICGQSFEEPPRAASTASPSAVTCCTPDRPAALARV